MTSINWTGPDQLQTSLHGKYGLTAMMVTLGRVAWIVVKEYQVIGNGILDTMPEAKKAAIAAMNKHKKDNP